MINTVLDAFHFSSLERKIKNAFINAEIYRVIDKDFKSYPEILGIERGEVFDTISFKLPHGVEPDLIERKWYVFEQYLGQNIDMPVKNNNNFYKIRVFKEVLNGTFDYDYEAIVKHKKFKQCVLPVIAGIDRVGQYVFFDLIDHPTLLISGITGSGKSVTLRSILTTLILHKRKGVEFHLTDLKRSEFFLYKNIDVVKTRVLNVKDLKKQLAYLQKQIDKRGSLLDDFDVEHIVEYNKLKGVKKENLIVFAFDEIGMLLKERDTKERDKLVESLMEIVSQGRALGVYTIVSVQRPDSKIMDSFIKSNLEVRFAHKAADSINSRISLGEGSKLDASEIKQKGQMYAKIDEYHVLQSPYLDRDVAKELLLPYKTLDLKPVYDAKPEKIQMGVVKYEGNS